MNTSVLFALDIAEGPLFRFALALALLGLARVLLLGASDAIAGYIKAGERADHRLFRRKVRLRLLWWAFPTVLLRRAGYIRTPGQFVYHAALSCISLVYRGGVILVPTFMVAHVYLWERALGLTWPWFGARLSDALSALTIVTGLVLFLGRIYSPVLRAIEPPWAFLKPLIVLTPFVTGMLAMHPTYCPFDYHVMLLLHVLSAALVLALLPVARLLSSLHVPLTRILPEAAWSALPEAEPAAANAAERDAEELAVPLLHK